MNSGFNPEPYSIAMFALLVLVFISTKWASLKSKKEEDALIERINDLTRMELRCQSMQKDLQLMLSSRVHKEDIKKDIPKLNFKKPTRAEIHRSKKRQQRIKELRQKTVVKPVKQSGTTDQMIINECLSAMVNLGYKKSDAIKILNSFSNQRFDTSEELLKVAVSG
tara:strand:- start:89 stop:586 length:498 start_codon:yes stop_codon:yes gene_type:complete